VKSKYDTHVLPKAMLVEAWARDGLSEEQIAKNLNVAYSTFKVYKGLHPALSAALTRGREVADVEVENAVFRRATGYDYVEKTQEHMCIPQEDGSSLRVLLKEKTITKHVPGDIKAQAFWLTNRKRGPDGWSNAPEAMGAADDDNTGVVMLPEINDDESS